MKIFLYLLLYNTVSLSLFGQKSPLPDTLFKICLDESLEPEGRFFPTCGCVNRRGDTIIPIGKYMAIMGDEFVHYVAVLPHSDGSGVGLEGVPAVDYDGNILFRLCWFDSWPDQVSDGMVRIVGNDLIGYADETGKIVVQPQYSCATQFFDGKAYVAYNCRTVPIDDEHKKWESDEWLIIDKKGDVVGVKKGDE